MGKHLLFVYRRVYKAFVYLASDQLSSIHKEIPNGDWKEYVPDDLIDK